MFYVLFGIFRFVPLRWRSLCLVAAGLTMGPRIIAYFPLWLIGVGCYRINRACPAPRAVGWILLISSTLALAPMLREMIGVAATGMFDPDHGPADIAQDYAIGFFFAANVVGFYSVASSFRSMARLERPIRWLAGATFSIYLFHYPVLKAVAAATMAWPRGSWSYFAAITAITFGTVLLLAQVTERQKKAWRNGIMASSGYASAFVRSKFGAQAPSIILTPSRG